MRRLIAAGVLLLAIIAVCIAGNLAVSRVCINAAEIADAGEQACVSQDWESALAHSQRLSDYWEKHIRLMSFFVDHGDIEELSSKTGSLAVLAEEQDSAAFREKIREILHLLETVSGEQQMNADAFL